MEATNILDVEKFVLECNDCLSGKFLDLNRRLEKLLGVMAQSEDVVALLSACLANFDDQAEFDAAFFVDKRTGGAKVVFPTDEGRKLALIATIFNKLTAQQQNANQFLETFFQDGNLSPMQNFLDRVVKTFRDLICKNFDVNPNLTAQDILKHELQLRAAEQERILAEQRAKEAEKLRLAQQAAMAQQILQQQAAAKAAQEKEIWENSQANAGANIETTAGPVGANDTVGPNGLERPNLKNEQNLQNRQNLQNEQTLKGGQNLQNLKNAQDVKYCQDVNNGQSLQAEEGNLPRLAELLSEVEKVANQIVATLKFEHRHAALVEDLEFLANAIIDGAQKGELMLVNGLVIGLDYAGKKLRSIRHLVQQLHNLIYSYYDFLEEQAQGLQNAQNVQNLESPQPFEENEEEREEEEREESAQKREQNGAKRNRKNGAIDDETDNGGQNFEEDEFSEEELEENELKENEFDQENDEEFDD